MGQGYKNTKMMVAAETVARKMPEAYGYYISMHGERPMAYYIEIGDDGVARLKVGFMDDGFVQGETMAPLSFTMCGADDRKMNNADFVKSFQRDYVDDYDFFGTTQDSEGVINTDVMTMLKRVANNGRERGWKLAPDKTKMRVNIVTENVWVLKKMVEEVVGGEIELVFPDHEDVKSQGLVCLGAAIGSDDFVETKWREAQEKKRIDVWH